MSSPTLRMQNSFIRVSSSIPCSHRRGVPTWSTLHPRGAEGCPGRVRIGTGPVWEQGAPADSTRGRRSPQALLGKTRALKGARSAELASPPPALLSLNLDLTLSTISLGTSALAQVSWQILTF